MSYNYSTLLFFEKDFNPVTSTVWMKQNWEQSIYLSVLYALFIFGGQRYMREKPGYGLKVPLILWNAALAVFSIMGMLRFAPDFLYVLRNFGFNYSICVASYAQGVTGFWTEMFAISKVLELGDTLFIILRKRQLIFLHWYHHITVLIYTWHAYKDHTAAGRWFIMMNYTVHSVMYTYYALRACGMWFPRWIPMTVTTMQLAQMVVGLVVAIGAYLTKQRGEFCQQTYENLNFSFLIYFSYFLLFAHFFYKVYFASTKYTKPAASAAHAVGAAGDHKDAANGVVKNGVMNGHHVPNGLVHRPGKKTA